MPPACREEQEVARMKGGRHRLFENMSDKQRIRFFRDWGENIQRRGTRQARFGLQGVHFGYEFWWSKPYRLRANYLR
jgi:hypothetical protein